MGQGDGMTIILLVLKDQKDEKEKIEEERMHKKRCFRTQ